VSSADDQENQKLSWAPETVTFATQTAQYIRVVLTAGVTTNWWSIAEFTVYAATSSGGTQPPAAPTGLTVTATSAVSATTRLLTVAALSPDRLPASWRLSGPLRKSCHSARDRLLRRRSRTVVVPGTGIHPPDGPASGVMTPDAQIVPGGQGRPGHPARHGGTAFHRGP
jgi:hypothetical protein